MHGKKGIRFFAICPLLALMLLCSPVADSAETISARAKAKTDESDVCSMRMQDAEIENAKIESAEIGGADDSFATEDITGGNTTLTDHDTVNTASIRGISAKAYVLYEPFGKEFIYEKNADERLPMASTTKIMTALAVAQICDMNETVIIGPEAIGIEGSSAFLRDGDKYTVEELLYALLLQSANDAAVALACYAGGGIEEFSAIMNKKASELGLENTNFANPHGLDDEEHYTSARDLAVIGAELLKNTTLKKIVSTYKKTFTYGERTRTYVNHNKLLLRYDGSIGMKTGYTKRSGRCLVGAATREGVTLICVTLDAPSDWADQSTLMDMGFDEFECVTLCAKGDHTRRIPVIDGENDFIDVSAKENLSIIKRKNESDIIQYLELPRYVIAPISDGDTVGRAVFRIGNREYAVDIIATSGSDTAKKSRGLRDLFNRFFGN